MKHLIPTISLRFIFFIIVILPGCSQITNPTYFADACPKNEIVCQRNATAKTLAVLGEREAAIELLCFDLKKLERLCKNDTDILISSASVKPPRLRPEQ